VEYLAHGPGYSLSLARGEALLSLIDEGGPRRPAQSAAVRVKVLGSNRRVPGRPSDLQTGKSNYFIGNNPNLWRRDLPHYGRVEYSGIYPGIDLAYYGAGQQLEYDFVVRPQARPRTIRLEFDGAERMSIDPSGDLVLAVRGSEIRERKPVAYQESAGERHAVEARYVLLGKKQVGFEVGSYDETIPLVIDPVLVYSTYLGSANNDLAYRVVLDAAGNTYYGGLSQATTLTGNAMGNAKSSGGVSKMIAKVSPAGVLLYTTFIGGTADQASIYGLDVDGNGNVYATGPTYSTDFPLVNDARHSSFAGGANDVFVLELDSTGSALVFSTLLGGSGNEYSVGLRLDSVGNIYVVGNTQSSNFPTTSGAYQTSLAGGKDAFLSKLAPGGTSLVYSTYFGGSSADDSNNITLDATGNAYIYGDTGSTNLPVLNAFQATYCGGTNTPTYGHGWLSKFSPSGSLVYSTFVCGSQLGYDTVRGAALDSSGDLIITGATSSTTFPTTAGAIQTSYGGTMINGGGDAFVMKVSPSGGLLYSSYLGGSNDDVGRGVAIDAEGNWYLTGQTASTNFPTANPLQSANGGSYDAFLTKINATGTAILFSTYLGGTQSDQGNDVVVDANGRAYLAGQTTSTNFPTKNPIQTAYGGGTNDAILAAIATCDFTLSAPGSVPANGVNGSSITITTTPECGWTTASNGTWVTLTSSAPGVGSGAVSYSVAANSGGPRNGSLTIGGLAVTISQQGAGPSLTSITPNSGTQGATITNLTLAGSNLSGATINVPTGITVSNVTTSAGSITATFAISTTATTGLQSVTVTANGVTSSGVGFTINPAPSLSSISPNSGTQGGTVNVTLSGSNLTGATINAPSGITVSGVTVTASSITATLAISSTAPTGAQSVTVTAGGVTSNAVTFTVNAGPSLNAITPTSGTQGATITNVTLAGSNLSGATINAPTGITVSNVTTSTGSITATFAISATATVGLQSVTVTAGGVTSNGVGFTINPAPSLSSISPNSGTQGGTVNVTLSGSNLTGATINAPSGLTVSGLTVSGVTVTASSITATFAISATATTGLQSVTVTANGVTSNGVGFTINPAPSLTSITPNSGTQGGTANVTIAGSNLTGATINTPSGLTVSGVTVTASSITATLAISATATTGLQSVTVTANGVTSNGVGFTINPAPSLSSISPNSGTQGGTVNVTIAGSNLTGATINAPSGITVSGVTVSAGSITATFAVSATAASGLQSVTVTANRMTSNAVGFTINPAPSLTSITPNSGAQGGTVGVTIAGSNLSGATINAPTGITVSNVTASAGSITATLAISSTAPTGAQSITVTAGGVTSNSIVFTVSAFTPIRINSGGGTYTDMQGNVWSPDSGYSGGSVVSTANVIAGTPDPGLYQNWRAGPDGAPLIYTFTGIQNGTRTVTLDFADAVSTAAGQRVFSVAINGVTVLANLDLYQSIGPNRAVSQSFTVTVSTGQIAIQFTKVAGNRPPLVNALAIQ
jgi:hypothetical protein